MCNFCSGLFNLTNRNSGCYQNRCGCNHNHCACGQYICRDCNGNICVRTTNASSCCCNTCNTCNNNSNGSNGTSGNGSVGCVLVCGNGLTAQSLNQCQSNTSYCNTGYYNTGCVNGDAYYARQYGYGGQTSACSFNALNN